MLSRFSLALVALFVTAGAAQAHAFGERYDLPVPLWMNLTGGGAVVVLSFAIAAWFLKPDAPVPVARKNILTADWVRPVALIVQFIAVYLFIIGLLAGFIGLPDYSRNAAPTIFWVIGWVGLAFASVLLGNVWLIVNPWRILFDWTEGLWRGIFGRGISLELPYPRQFGVLPGIVMVVGFTWFMLASGLAGDSRALACAVSIYSAMTWTGMLLFSPAAWLSHGEAFTLMFGVLARFSPTALRVSDPSICARTDCPPEKDGSCVDCPEAFLLAPSEKREITLHGYGLGLIVKQPLALSMIILVLMILGLVAFEGFMDTAQWIDLMVSLGELEASDGIHAPVKTTLCFLAATAILFALF